MGSTIHEEIVRVRLERVKSLLQTTDMTISEIAYLCGYNEEGYLSMVFKEKFGMTMTEYRNSIFHRASL